MAGARFIYGFHAIQAKLRCSPLTVIAVYYDANRHDERMLKIIAYAESMSLSCVPLERTALGKMLGDAVQHQGIIARVRSDSMNRSVEEILADIDENIALFLILDEVTDPHNLGACLRVADAVGAHAVIAPRDRSAPLNAQAIKIAAGAAEAIPYIQVPNLATTIKQLKNYGIWIIGACGLADECIYDKEDFMTRPLAWVLGSEGKGLRRLTRENCDTLAQIPMSGHVESLNVAVATGICLFETRRVRAKSLTQSAEIAIT